MTASIHPTAFVDPSAEISDGVVVGPHAVLGAGVSIGEGTEIGAAAQIQGPTRIGRENRVFPHATLGFDPQDLKYNGEKTELIVGDRNHFREFCTIHRGTGFGGGKTTIGNDNLFMVYTHVAHDSHVGDRCILVNNATLGGHVEVHDDATIGAFTSVHQFTRVGRHAYLGGYTVLTMDALPYGKTVGQKPACYGVNRIGLERKGVGEEALARIEGAFRLLLRSAIPLAEAVEKLTQQSGGHPEIDYLIEYLRASKRGVVKRRPGTGKNRGGGDDEVASTQSGGASDTHG